MKNSITMKVTSSCARSWSLLKVSESRVKYVDGTLKDTIEAKIKSEE
jgi:hypothetical protein